MIKNNRGVAIADSGILGSRLVVIFSAGTSWPLGWVIGAAGIGCLLSTLLLLPGRVGEDHQYITTLKIKRRMIITEYISWKRLF